MEFRADGVRLLAESSPSTPVTKRRPAAELPCYPTPCEQVYGEAHLLLWLGFKTRHGELSNEVKVPIALQWPQKTSGSQSTLRMKTPAPSALGPCAYAKDLNLPENVDCLAVVYLEFVGARLQKMLRSSASGQPDCDPTTKGSVDPVQCANHHSANLKCIDWFIFGNVSSSGQLVLGRASHSTNRMLEKPSKCLSLANSLAIGAN